MPIRCVRAIRNSARKRLFVGSGVIECGCKTVLGSRLKQSGMFWTLRGANAIINMRYDANEVMNGVTEVLAYGTAVVVEKID